MKNFTPICHHRWCDIYISMDGFCVHTYIIISIILNYCKLFDEEFKRSALMRSHIKHISTLIVRSNTTPTVSFFVFFRNEIKIHFLFHWNFYWIRPDTITIIVVFYIYGQHWTQWAFEEFNFWTLQIINKVDSFEYISDRG